MRAWNEYVEWCNQAEVPWWMPLIAPVVVWSFVAGIFLL